MGKPARRMESSATVAPGKGELFLVATPIGNLKDITLRALEVLQAVDAIACEDTRTSGGLLTHFGITTKMIPYHTHNEAKATAELLQHLAKGARIALISDAGTPLVSDPGAKLVQAALRAGIRVTPIPGASAVLCALSMAGLSTESFYFGGFLPNKAAARKKALAAIQTLPTTLVFYEAPHRLTASLADMLEVYGDRPAAVARELTKRFEECVRGRLSEVVAHFTATPARGECVVLIEGATPGVAVDDGTLDARLRAALARMRLKEAVAEVALHAGRPKSEVYARALALKAEGL
jgi:16S rRNA (cytidine1402-2'-O)-methyltransferase